MQLIYERMDHSINRRNFLKRSALATAGLGAAVFTGPISGLASPNDLIRVGIMGTGIRGNQVARGFARLPGAEVAYLCDVDAHLMEEAAQSINQVQDRSVEQAQDFRRILDDSEVDALVITAADHWHTPASLLALDAGKHVYVEKPGSHNAHEAELIVEAANAGDRVVQMGNQRRSWPALKEAMAALHSGLIGDVYFARAWYASSRGPTHLSGTSSPPAYLDWELWQGPAPRTDYDETYHPYDWHWFWRWGTGEAGNIGCHALDLCRWGLDVDYPSRVSSHGGTHHFDDDWETPDVQVATFEFDNDKTVSWESRSRNSRPIEGSGFGVSFHGEGGSVVIQGGNGYAAYNNDNDLIREVRGYGEGQNEAAASGFDIDFDHLQNFTDAIRTSAELRSPIADAQKSTMMCHLANIAYRSRSSLVCNPDTGRIQNDELMETYWARSYDADWRPQGVEVAYSR